MVQCQAKYNSPAAKKASDEDANGLESMILLAEGAHIMIIVISGLQKVLCSVWSSN